MSSNEPILTVDGVSTRFRTKRGQLRAVEQVSLELDAGETLGLVGESGSGKSVLGQTIMGLVSNGGNTTVTGTVKFMGRDMQGLTRKEQQQMWGNDIAMVFQDPMSALNPFKRIGTHLTESLRAHLGLDKAAARERAIELLRKVRIPEPTRRIDQYPHELSGGMRQRVVIAMALACDPKLTIADEPTTALDVTVQKQILELLDSLRTEMGMAGILVSHDLGVVAGQTDRVAVMYAGRIVETAPTRQLFASPRHPYTEALLAAVPRLEQEPHTRLESIDGGLPDMTKPPTGCSFASRCKYAQAKCREVVPTLTASADTAGARHPHEVACHFPLDGVADLGMPAAAGTEVRELEVETI
ncbi:ATP-binding cassette domain-containing protein [Rhodococcus hoagii]|nr:ATP-binding cassette domain-containing protein [Prescottella equi]MBM4651723.1 ATP-binding cassette domain-containing protein [Prescottella equi]MBM4684538.1 ATP-binding cassette domain-containing protein [Prescottella equi]NKZ64962.1 ATP-binding cassette domain-containing protein [Prescottella equi]